MRAVDHTVARWESRAWAGRLAARLALLALLWLLGCGREELPVVTAAREGQLLLGNGTEPTGLDPHLVTGVSESRILRALMEGLVGLDPQTLEPVADAAAERWEVSEDGLVYTFYLREDATWSNGDPVLAEHFAYAFHRILHPDLGAPYAYMLFPLRGAQAYHEGNVGQLLWLGDDGAPAAPELLAQVDFKARADSGNTWNQRGLNALSAAELGELAQQPERFDWPEGLEVSAQLQIIEGLRVYREAGSTDLWNAGRVGVEVVEPRVLRCELTAPAPYFLSMLTHYTWYPVHPPTIEAHGGMTARESVWTQPEHFVGNGPFRLEEWQVQTHILVEKRPGYWDADAVRLQAIRFLPIDNIETEQRAYRAGMLHVTYTVPPHRVDWNQTHFPGQQRFDAYLGTYFYRLNLRGATTPRLAEAQAVLQDVRVRQALSLAIDRSAITQFLGAGQIPAYHFTPPDTAGYTSPYRLRYDPEAARTLLAEAGYPGGQGMPRLEILYNTSEAHKQVAEIVQQMWAEQLGVETQLANQEWKTYLQSIKQGEYVAARAGWIGDYVDPNTFLDMWLTGGGNNRTGFSHPEYDRLIQAAAMAGSQPEERMRLLAEAEALLLQELPVIPLYFYVSSKLIRPEVRGWNPNLLDVHPYKNVWLEVSP